ncbi:efflux RND transporter permease subunit [Rubrivirga sp.]|uniref:efflux RND transporter permease subunit n=1 Tax=Rubrivirga sp. TaxID=1885344 RepID=UPI003B520216
MVFDRLRFIPRTTVHHPFLVVGVALLLAGLGIWKALDLRVDANIVTLLPPEYKSVQAIQRLQETVGAETTVDVAIHSPSFEHNLAFAQSLVPAAMTMERPGTDDPYFTRVDFRRDVRFVSENALYFATFEELDRLEAFLREQAQQVRSATDPLRMDLFRVASDSARQARQREGDQLRADLAQLALTEYFLSPDSTTLVVKFYPTGAQTDIGFVEQLYADLDSTIARVGPERYDPEMTVTAAGRLLRQTIEVRSITTDVRNSFGAGVLSVILAVVLYFLYKSIQARTGGRLVWSVVGSELLRTPVTALLLTVPLLISLSWAGGLAAVTFGTLNLMTSTLGLVLFGLGIDYGIHFYARYAEERGAGQSVPDAVEETFVSTGQGIAVSALTTASALFVLQIADFRGFSEFGLIGGVGILFALVSMLTVLPALLAIAERTGALDLRLRGEASHVEVEPRFPFSRTIVVACLAITVVCVVAIPSVSFEYNFSNLEPEYDEYYRRAEALEPVFGQSERRNPAYILLDSPESVKSVTEAVGALAEQDSLILAVESLQERFPTDSAGVAEKLARLADIREVLDDPFLLADTTGQIARLRRAASATEPIPLDSVPAFLTRPFTTRSGEVGDFVIVFPRGNMADGRRSIRFAELIGQVTTPEGGSFYAASTQLVAADMLRLMQEESPLMVGVTFVLVFVLVYISFRSLKWTLVAVVPLVVGLSWMLGMMELFGVQLTFYNLVVLPTVLGIGNDGGVHLTHRYREEGRGSIRRVLRSTGEHVTMGALTNLVGFGGLLLSSHPGLRSIGVLAVVGIGGTLAATLIFYPALLQVVEDNHWLDRRRRRRRQYDLGDPDAIRHPTFRLHPSGEPSSDSDIP